MSHVLFISDLHLNPALPHITELFQHFLENHALKAEALYILGDLFEVWIGDDAMTPWSVDIAHSIAHVAQQGVAVYLMPGNRDFLLSQQFAQLARCTLLKDPSVIELYGKTLLLKHGDDLCSLDRSHQWFRSVAQSSWVKKLYLSLAVSLRLAIANKIRQLSSGHKPKDSTIMDVVPHVYKKQMLVHQADLLIHGHTHNPTLHYFREENRYLGHIVLGDWHHLGNFGRLMQNGQFFLESFAK